MGGGGVVEDTRRRKRASDRKEMRERGQREGLRAMGHLRRALSSFAGKKQRRQAGKGERGGPSLKEKLGLTGTWQRGACLQCRGAICVCRL